MTEPRRPESFPQCPDTGLRFSVASYEIGGPWYVEDIDGNCVCKCMRRSEAMMIALALENAAHYAQQHEDYLAACWCEHIGFDPILLGM